ncbi:uncharacterized protein [Clinocottus analis]|uniref:uncharacterized protein isoform X1 n=1 Tax=Clinocottus analis TaxID=304258 RepID=UPI0035C09770
MIPGQDVAVARCRVKTEVQELMSEPVTLELVPVGGDLKVEVEYLYSADSKLAAAKLSCHVSRGTFPYISWFFNNSALPSETHEDSHIQPDLHHGVFTDRRRTLVLAKLGPEESGYYRCRARDSYNDSGPWVESEAVLVRVSDRIHNSMPPAASSTYHCLSKKHILYILKPYMLPLQYIILQLLCPFSSTEVFLNTIEILTIVFCSFLFLMLAVGIGCVYKMFDHKQAHAHVATTNSHALPTSAPTSHSGGKQDDNLSTDV